MAADKDDAVATPLQPPPQPTPPDTQVDEPDDVVTTGRIPRVPKPPPQPVPPRRRRWWLYGLIAALALALAAGLVLLFPRLAATPEATSTEQTTPIASPSPSPTPYTSAQLRAAAADALDRCMNEQALYTSCGFGWGGLAKGATPDLSTLHWTYHTGSSNTLREAEFIMQPDATKATAAISIMVDVDVYDTAGVHYIDSLKLTTASVDFTDPAAPIVTITPVA